MKEKHDFRSFLAIVFTAISSSLTYLGDQVTFIRPPRGVFENIGSLIHIAAYRLTETRLYTNAIAYVAYSILLLVIYHTLSKWYADNVLWPKKVAKMMKDLSLQKDLAQRYNRDKRGDCIV